MTGAEEKTGVEAVQAAQAPALRFTGRYPGKLDAKGRIILPPPFRQKLAGAPISFFPSLTEPALMIGGPSLYDDLLDLMLGFDEFDGDRQVLEYFVSQRLAELSLDDAGRVVLPAELRAHAALDGLCGFAGRGGHFILAAGDYLDTIEAAAKAAADKFADVFKARMLPSVTRGRKR